MPQYQNYQQDDDDDDDQQPNPCGQQQDEDDDDDDNQRSQAQQQQQADNDDDNNDSRGVEPQQNDDGDDDNNRTVQWGQQGDDDDDAQRGNAPQQQDDDNDDDDDAGNTQKGIQQAQDNDDDDPAPSPPDDPPPDDDVDNDDDGQTAAKSSNVNISFNINLGGDLEDSDLHEGGLMFSKKLLTQLFSGPGEHDPNEKEVPVHQVQHEPVETADSGEWTIVQLKTQDATGATIYLKAKLDSGADDNFMSFDIYEVTGLDFTPYEGPEGPPTFTMGGGQESEPLGTVRLEYTAGIKPQKFIETFQVMEGLPHDVIIGKPLMTAAHMMMVNPNFANPPEHKALCLMELPPKDKDSKAKALAFQKQRAAEQAAAYEAKIKAQEAAAPNSGKKHLFGRFGKH